MEPQNPYFITGRNAFLAGDWKVARKQYKAAVKVGSVSALHNLGVMLLHGQGCLVDYTRAREFFQESAMHGICESMNQLGYMYYYGKGCPQDFYAARSWFLGSEMNGSHPYAQYHLGIISALGQGVQQDWREAAKWLQLSADQGYAPAIYNLGVLYFNGDGVKQSFDHALELYARAAIKGHAASENNFAVMCAEGLGTLKRSVDEVMAFWERAAAKNVSEAHYNLVNIHLTVDVSTRNSGIGEPEKLQAPARELAQIDCQPQRSSMQKSSSKSTTKSPAKSSQKSPSKSVWPDLQSRGLERAKHPGKLNLDRPDTMRIRSFSQVESPREPSFSTVTRARATSISHVRPRSSSAAATAAAAIGSGTAIARSRKHEENGTGEKIKSEYSSKQSMSMPMKSLPTRKSKPPPLPPLKPRQSSRRVDIIAPPSPFFHDIEFDKTPLVFSRALPRSPTEPNFREIHNQPALPRSASYMQIKPAPQVNRSLPTPEQSPLAKHRVSASASKKKVPLARLATTVNSTMPPTPDC